MDCKWNAFESNEHTLKPAKYQGFMARLASLVNYTLSNDPI